MFDVGCCMFGPEAAALSTGIEADMRPVIA